MDIYLADLRLGKYLHYSPTLRWTIIVAYTSHNCFPFICFHFQSLNFSNNFTELSRLVAHSSFVNKTFWTHPERIWLKSKRYANLWILSCRITLLFWHCLARRLRLLKKSSSIAQTKRDVILICPEVNSAGYSEIEESIRLRRKRYSSARYMLNKSIHFAQR